MAAAARSPADNSEKRAAPIRTEDHAPEAGHDFGCAAS
jgi:hypothetical protein